MKCRADLSDEKWTKENNLHSFSLQSLLFIFCVPQQGFRLQELL
jgi:hypothetical protein